MVVGQASKSDLEVHNIRCRIESDVIWNPTPPPVVVKYCTIRVIKESFEHENEEAKKGRDEIRQQIDSHLATRAGVLEVWGLDRPRRIRQ